MTEGWVRIGRKMTEWEWYSDANVVRLFLHLILMANYRDAQWHGITIRRGQWIASREKLSRQIGLTVRQIRRAESKLVASGSLVVKGATKFTIYTVVKYEDYQADVDSGAHRGHVEGNQGANKGQQEKKNKKEKNKDNTMAASELPEWIDTQLWEAFKEMRKGLKSPMTPKAEQLIIGKLADFRGRGHDPTAILEQSIRNNWKDVYQLKEEHHATTRFGSQGHNPRPSKDDRARAAVLRAVAAFDDPPVTGGEEAARGPLVP